MLTYEQFDQISSVASLMMKEDIEENNLPIELYQDISTATAMFVIQAYENMKVKDEEKKMNRTNISNIRHVFQHIIDFKDEQFIAYLKSKGFKDCFIEPMEKLQSWICNHGLESINWHKSKDLEDLISIAKKDYANA